MVGVDSVQLMDSLLSLGQEAGRFDEGVEDMDTCQEMLGKIMTGLRGYYSNQCITHDNVTLSCDGKMEIF